MGSLHRLAVELEKTIYWVQEKNLKTWNSSLCKQLDAIHPLMECEEISSGNLEEFSALCQQGNEKEFTSSSDLISSILDTVMNSLPNQTKFWIIFNSEVCKRHLRKCKTNNFEPCEVAFICQKILGAIQCIVVCCEEVTLQASAVLGLNQILTKLPLFVVGVKQNSQFIQNYAASCLEECIENIQKGLEENDATESSSNFLDYMDSALGLLDDGSEHAEKWANSDNVVIDRLKELIHELLCHSMSTAQVASCVEDQKNISSKAQMILRNLESMEKHIEEKDALSTRLLADALSDNLCSLERAVNATVLRLVVTMSAAPEQALKDLVAICHDAESAETTDERLEEAIRNFDVFIDSLMQIGSFAVSCTSNKNKSIQLKSCLASFESMEAEIVPRVKTLCLKNTSQNKRDLRLLLEHWHSEQTIFGRILDSIIDPAAYAEIVKERIAQLNAEIRGCAESSAGAKLLKTVVHVAGTLNGILVESQNQESSDESREKIASLTKSISDAIDKCKRHHMKLRELKEFSDCHRVLVLSKVQNLMDVIDELWTFLAEQVVKINDTSFGESQNEITNVDANGYYNLCPANEDLLTPFITRGQLLTKESVFYNTPQRKSTVKSSVCRTKLLSTNRATASTTRDRCFRQGWYTPHVDSTEKSKCDPSDTVLGSGRSSFRGRRLLDMFTSFQTEKTVGDKTVDSSSLFTPDRIADLLRIEEKIANLRAQES